VFQGWHVSIPFEINSLLFPNLVNLGFHQSHMLIAATAMELGSVWIGGFDQSSIRAILDIPDHVFPIGIVYFGYLAERIEPRTKYIEEAVYW
jgi:hypothetical protein